MIQTLLDYYRVPEASLGSTAIVADGSAGEVGFFEFGAKNICYGRCQSGVSEQIANSGHFDASKAIRRKGSTVEIPFDFTEIVDNLRLEHYRKSMIPARNTFVASEAVRKLYYLARNYLPVSLRSPLQKVYFRDWRELPFPAWPVDFTVDNIHEVFLRLLMEAGGTRRVPFIWFWPDGAPNCLIMTHDVESLEGRRFTSELIDLDNSYGFKASYQVIPQHRYDLPDEYISEIRDRGCELNIHDLRHDGRLFKNRAECLRQAAEINAYVRKYNARGFRAGSMYRNQDWYDVFEFSYDMSVPNVAHLEPMRGGCCTVMPYFVGKILELPLTTVQDYSLFNILNDYSIDLWKRQTTSIAEKHGLMSFIAHPDYLQQQRARYVFESLLSYLREIIDRDKIWATLPGEVDTWWRLRSQMKLVQKNGAWEVEGAGAERARVAFAVIDGDRLVYEVAGAGVCETAS